MNRRIACAFLAITCLVATNAWPANADPIVGTWQLNAAKSKFTSGPAWKSQTRTYTQSGDSISLVMKTELADGSQSTSETTYKLDGKDYAVSGNPDYDTLAPRQVDSHTTAFTMKKAGKPVGTTTRTVSPDGKTMTSTISYMTTQGKKSEGSLVFDRK